VRETHLPPNHYTGAFHAFYYNRMRQISGKRALVTGAASGIGREIALRLAAQRVDLLLLDIDQVGLEHVAQEAADLGVDVATRYCDVSDAQQVDAAAGDAIQRWAGVDILVNNAGITYYGFTHEMTDEQWDRLLAINLHAPLRLTRALLPSLLARPEAHVLNVCSVLGLVGMPRVAAYCTAKFGLVGFSDTLRAEYGRSGLGVTALCPGFAKTNLFAAAEPRPGATQKTPPAALCTTPERVAKAAVRAIRRNQAVVRLEPFSRVLYTAKLCFPTVLDWALRLGHRRRTKKKQQQLSALSSDSTVALRMAIDLEAKKLDQRRAA